MSNLYYNNAEADGDLNNVDNWWSDFGFSIPAGSLPTNIDYVNIYADATSGTVDALYIFVDNTVVLSGSVTLNAATTGDEAITFTGEMQDGVTINCAGLLFLGEPFTTYGLISGGVVNTVDLQNWHGNITGGELFVSGTFINGAEGGVADPPASDSIVSGGVFHILSEMTNWDGTISAGLFYFDGEVVGTAGPMAGTYLPYSEGEESEGNTLDSLQYPLLNYFP
jgi:hypothetical protein